MTATLVGAAIALGLVLVVLGLALRALNRFVSGGRLGGGRMSLDVVARVGLGPRQGLAVVRVGERGVLVSMGDGGIRPVLELSEAEIAALVPEEDAAAGWPRGGRRSGDEGSTHPFLRRLRAMTGLTALALLPLLAGAADAAALTGSGASEGAGDDAAGALVATSLTALPATAAPSVTVVPSADPAAPDFAGTAAIVQVPGTSGSGASASGAPAEASAAATGAAIDSVTSQLFPRMSLQVGDDDDGLRLSGTVGTVVVIGLLTLLPTLLLLMTSFTRIVVVLHFLRQALGTQNAPPAHLLAALALLLTGFVMAPTLREVNATALKPWTEGLITEGEMLAAASDPIREFMLRQTSEEDLVTFLDLSGSDDVVTTPEEVPMVALVSAFAIGELRTAFQIGFVVFLPFIVIDLVVAAVLTSMGMFMLPPTMVALPLKLMLFVLVDGWSLVVQSLVSSFH